jgi:hypothetical protein
MHLHFAAHVGGHSLSRTKFLLLADTTNHEAGFPRTSISPSRSLQPV